MLDEDDQPVERLVVRNINGLSTQDEVQENLLKLYYLHIPSGKNRGPFWIWLPDYVAGAINAWKRERPCNQRKLLDRKDREEVDYLFCYRDARVGTTFINYSLIPALCVKAGVDIEDAKGRITGHRGRSSRLTLLRSRGVSLDDLAEYAGHTDTKTIRRYARQDPILLHHIVRDADDVSRIIEGVVDVQAAAQGLPALRWFIGYDTDGEPMYCGNQLYVTCPHRLHCERCGMFIGGEKARFLHEGTNTLPITSKVPMTPIERCTVTGDREGEEACRAALQHVPAPETPDIALIFNPEGLSNRELEKLAKLGTVETLDKLRQALDAHEKRLEEAQQHKTGHSALVGAQRRRIKFIQDLIADCERGCGMSEKAVDGGEESRQAHQASWELEARSGC
jgi:Phage integrase family